MCVSRRPSLDPLAQEDHFVFHPMPIIGDMWPKTRRLFLTSFSTEQVNCRLYIATESMEVEELARQFE